MDQKKPKLSAEGIRTQKMLQDCAAELDRLRNGSLIMGFNDMSETLFRVLMTLNRIEANLK